MTDLPLSPAEQEAMESAAQAFEFATEPFEGGWLVARSFYAEQSEAFAAAQKLEWDAMRQRLEEADLRNALLLKTGNEKAEELKEAEQELEQAEQRHVERMAPVVEAAADNELRYKAAEERERTLRDSLAELVRRLTAQALRQEVAHWKHPRLSAREGP